MAYTRSMFYHETGEYPEDYGIIIEEDGYPKKIDVWNEDPLTEDVWHYIFDRAEQVLGRDDRHVFCTSNNWRYRDSQLSRLMVRIGEEWRQNRQAEEARKEEARKVEAKKLEEAKKREVVRKAEVAKKLEEAKKRDELYNSIIHYYNKIKYLLDNSIIDLNQFLKLEKDSNTINMFSNKTFFNNCKNVFTIQDLKYINTSLNNSYNRLLCYLKDYNTKNLFELYDKINNTIYVSTDITLENFSIIVDDNNIISLLKNSKERNNHVNSLNFNGLVKEYNELKKVEQLLFFYKNYKLILRLLKENDYKLENCFMILNIPNDSRDIIKKIFSKEHYFMYYKDNLKTSELCELNNILNKIINFINGYALHRTQPINRINQYIDDICSFEIKLNIDILEYVDLNNYPRISDILKENPRINNISLLKNSSILKIIDHYNLLDLEEELRDILNSLKNKNMNPKDTKTKRIGRR